MSQSSPASVSSSSDASVAAPSDTSSMPSTDCVPRISDLDFARISRLLAPNSSQANPFQPDSFSVAEVTAYHEIVLDLFREFCEPIPLVLSSIEGVSSCTITLRKCLDL
ncbi:hypothetical protein PSTT_16609 [Puccinia striiformis]|uniref:Uncharacterized protein n=1 Tax=Puccinia striiformis TaxID=27350 RepID=A0A2S4UC56_9BASI|nr:hypothetical protein PSTT_16609 [Puccinia striiformis]